MIPTTMSTLKSAEEGVEVVEHSPSATENAGGGLSIVLAPDEKHRADVETLDTCSAEEIGQEATWEETYVVSSAKSAFGSIFKSLRRKSHPKRATNIILPPQINLALEDERRQEANQKADYARRLLDAAFREQHVTRKEYPAEFQGMKRDDMIPTAFKYAVQARQLSSEGDVAPEILEQHRRQGQEAALEASRLLQAYRSKALLPNVDVDVEDDGSINGGLYTPQDIQDAASYAKEVARSHLEYILETFEKKIKAPEHIILNRSPKLDKDGQTLSTLGFDNTFAQEPSPTRNDKFSITSLNEIMDGPVQSTTPSSSKPNSSKYASSQQTPVSPLTEVQYTQIKPEVESKGRSRSLIFRRKDKAKIKPGAILLPAEEDHHSVTQKVVVARSDTDSDDISEISELESIRSLEREIDAKLKQAAADGDGEFSIVGEEARMLAPTMLNVPSFDPEVMSLENWDNIVEGCSLDDIIASSKRLKENAEPRGKQADARKQSPMRSLRVWRRRSDIHLVEDKKASRKKEMPAIPIADRAQSMDDHEALGDGSVEELRILACDTERDGDSVSVPPKVITIGVDNQDEMSESSTAPGKREPKWKIMSWRRRSVLKTSSIPDDNCAQSARISITSNEHVNDQVVKGVTSSTEIGAPSEDEGDAVDKYTAASHDEYGDKYRSLSEEVDSVDAKARQRLRSTRPIVSDVDMFLPETPADTDAVRKVLSADGGGRNVEANAVDFAQVEIGGDAGAVQQTEKTLVSRQAILQQIYAERLPIAEAPKPLERSNTAPYIVPHSAFQEMLDQDEIDRRAGKHERKSKRFSGIFGRKKEKVTAPHAVYVSPMDLSMEKALEDV